MAVFVGFEFDRTCVVVFQGGVSKITEKMTEWLGANMQTYERHMLHAIFHDPQHRANLVGTPLLRPADFERVEYAIVVGGLITAQHIAQNLGREIAYPPTRESMQTFVHLAASEEYCCVDEDIDRAMQLVQELQDPSLKNEHHLVNPYFVAWFSTMRGKKAARQLQMKKIPDVASFLEQMVNDIAAASEITNPAGSREFDFDNPPEPPEPILTLGKHTICTPGNISNIQGPPKTAKSAVVGAIIAAILLESWHNADTLGFTAGDLGCGAVIHIDTEQSAHDHYSLIRRAYTRAKRTNKAHCLHSYCFTGMDPAACWDSLVSKTRKAAAQHNGVKMIIIDGIADFCSDPNDAKECFNLVRKLHKLALDHQCVILTVLHENPGSATGKTRGHLGSQLDRKAETSLRLLKDEKSGTVTMWAERARHCFMPKSSGWQFRWCDEAMMHVTLSEDDEAYARAKPDKQSKYTGEVTKAFGQNEALSYTDLVKTIAGVAGIAESTAKTRIPEYEKQHLIEKTTDGKYRVVQGLCAA